MESQRVFALLMGAQALHSLEEYSRQLWASFPPARFVSGLVSADLEFGFLVLNVALMLVGVLCYMGPIRGRWKAATVVAWSWVGVEAVNGIVHPTWSVMQGGYTPGLLTSLLLFPLAVWLGRSLLRARVTISASHRDG